MTTLMATQPTYLPHVHLLARALKADELVLLGSAQFTKRTKTPTATFPTGQNSTGILGTNGPHQLTVPVARGRQPINVAAVVNDGWQDVHLRSIEHAYGRAEFYDDVALDLAWLLHRSTMTNSPLGILTKATWLWALGRLGGISDIRLCMDPSQVAEAVSQFAPLRTISDDRDVLPDGHPPGSDWMLALAVAGDHDYYLAGRTAAEQYLDLEAFERADVKVVVDTFRPQPWPQRNACEFIADVSFIDLVASVGWDGARRRLLTTTAAGRP